jgi:hypothetical protein
MIELAASAAIADLVQIISANVSTARRLLLSTLSIPGISILFVLGVLIGHLG